MAYEFHGCHALRSMANDTQADEQQWPAAAQRNQGQHCVFVQRLPRHSKAVQRRVLLLRIMCSRCCG